MAEAQPPHKPTKQMNSWRRVWFVSEDKMCFWNRNTRERQSCIWSTPRSDSIVLRERNTDSSNKRHYDQHGRLSRTQKWQSPVPPSVTDSDPTVRSGFSRWWRIAAGGCVERCLFLPHTHTDILTHTHTHTHGERPLSDALLVIWRSAAAGGAGTRSRTEPTPSGLRSCSAWSEASAGSRPWAEN